ncbi:MAG TPA: transcriptional regulator NrdR [Pirellulales bacterium]|nr:transcriptional regulator NrdR [Pirellulales bacterium]
MQCPFCRRDNDRVIDSRASEDGFAIRRRRECTVCKRRYTTYERVEEPSIKVVKKDGVREPFSREKIKSGLQKACWKRPVSDEQIEAIVATVENDIYANFDNEVSSRHLGDLLMDQLRELDQVAFVRFASVYRQFKDVRDFVEELGPMLAEERAAANEAPGAAAGASSAIAGSAEPREPSAGRQTPLAGRGNPLAGSRPACTG